VTKKYAAELDWKARAERDFESTVQKAGDVSVRCQSYSEQNAALKGQLSIAEQSIASLEKVRIVFGDCGWLLFQCKGSASHVIK
jgi:hypothetical protein